MGNCPTCGGAGFYDSNYLTCPHCNGTGEARGSCESTVAVEKPTRLDRILSILFFAILALFCVFCLYGIIHLITLIPNNVNEIIKYIARIIFYGLFIAAFLAFIIQRFFKKKQ